MKLSNKIVKLSKENIIKEPSIVIMPNAQPNINSEKQTVVAYEINVDEDKAKPSSAYVHQHNEFGS